MGEASPVWCGRDARAPGWAAFPDVVPPKELHRYSCPLVVRLQNDQQFLPPMICPAGQGRHLLETRRFRPVSAAPCPPPHQPSPAARLLRLPLKGGVILKRFMQASRITPPLRGSRRGKRGVPSTGPQPAAEPEGGQRGAPKAPPAVEPVGEQSPRFVRGPRGRVCPLR